TTRQPRSHSEPDRQHDHENRPTSTSRPRHRVLSERKKDQQRRDGYAGHDARRVPRGVELHHPAPICPHRTAPRRQAREYFLMTCFCENPKGGDLSLPTLERAREE